MSVGSKILIVDDEPQIRKLLAANLEAAGFSHESVSNGKEAIDLVARDPFNAVILDLGLPDMDGTLVVSRIREWSLIPILVLSIRTGVEDKVAALDLGADDYLTKPFHASELLARLRAILRHAPRETEPPILEIAGLRLDFASHRISRGENEIHLSATEYGLLKLLAENAGKVVTHRQILQTVWGGAPEADPARLRVFMNYLRKKIEVDPSRPTLIRSEPGIGYRLVEKERT
ncbi:MAG: response regulator transcription factor [Spirochaetia bacterium]|nr:response regulator transcription factor [Spirochaetia bacterium]